MPQPEIPDGFVRFAHAAVESPMLRSWFYELEALSERYRGACLFEMARHIGREDEELAVTAFKLCDLKIYKAVLVAVRERVRQTADRI